MFQSRLRLKKAYGTPKSEGFCMLHLDLASLYYFCSICFSHRYHCSYKWETRRNFLNWSEHLLITFVNVTTFYLFTMSLLVLFPMIYSLIQQLSMEHLLSVWHSSRHWEPSSECNKLMLLLCSLFKWLERANQQPKSPKDYVLIQLMGNYFIE